MDQQTTVLDAIRANNLAQVRELLSADPTLGRARDANGVSALMLALYHQQPDTAALLREALREIDVFEAAALGDVARVELLLDASPGTIDVRASDGFAALHLACFFGRVEAVRALIARGADVVAVADNPSQVQPIHSSIPGGHAAIVTLLLDAGANVDAVQMGGWTALMAAAKRGDPPLIELLLAAGADRSAQAEHGKTAYDLAADEARNLLS